MDNATKTLREWEKESYYFITDASQDELDQPLTLQQYQALCSERDTTVVIYNDRVEFLVNNGYELTRENLFNPSLSARQIVEDDTTTPTDPDTSVL